MLHSEKKVGTIGLCCKFNKMRIDCDKIVIRRNQDGGNKLRRYRSEPYATTQVICKELTREPSDTITIEGNDSSYPVKRLDFNNIK